MRPYPLRILSYNVHKGSSLIRRRDILSDIRDAIHELAADIVFLQEVKGESRSRQGEDLLKTQFAYLADGIWPHVAYGPNVVRDSGHHGNAILSRFPIVSSENIDISAHRVDRRGILHAVMEVPAARRKETRSVHALCLHLGLFERWRMLQMDRIEERVRTAVPDATPLLVAGDFNDWRGRTAGRFAEELSLTEAFQELHGEYARTFPSALPALKLDRIFLRGLEVVKAERLSGIPWTKLSDHVPLLIEVV